MAPDSDPTELLGILEAPSEVEPFGELGRNTLSSPATLSSAPGVFIYW